MLRKALVLVAVLAVFLLAGCTSPTKGAVWAPIMMTKSPVQVVDTTVSPALTGEATAEGIILLARGDASIKTAMDNGGITRVHHVDSEELNILGIYSKQTTRVYGE